MNYRRALFIAELGKDATAHLAVLRRVAPGLEHLLVVAELPASAFGWLTGAQPSGSDEGAAAALAALRVTTAGAAPSIDFRLAPALGGDVLTTLCIGERIDLLVFGPRSLWSAWVASTGRRRQSVAVLWSEGPRPSGPLREVACVALDDRSRAEIGAFLRDHADRSLHVTLLSPTALAPDIVATSLQVAGISATVEVSSLHDAPSLQRWLADWTRERSVDLLVFARISTALLVASLREVPVLLLPPRALSRPFARRAIDVPDLLDDGGPIRVCVEHLAAVGRLAPVPDQPLAFVSDGRVITTVTTRGGEAALPPGLGLRSVGVYRVDQRAADEPLAAIEQRVAVIGPGERPLVVFDAELPDGTLRALAGFTDRSAADALAVRVRPTRSCRSIRRRLRALGLRSRVLDARLVLDEGEALDVSEALDPIRLARVAARLRTAGFPVAAIVHGGPVEPRLDAFASLTARDLAADASVALAVRPPPAAAPPIPGNRVELELDNTVARNWLLEAIARSTKTLHFQIYMALDDDVGAPVEAALAAAGARGVAVRVVVDSLHGLHGSFGARNPLFERLAARPGVELRALQPITQLPSLADLKRRDHRKLLVADGQVALVGGRNLSHEYYVGFDEVPITPASLWRKLPWLDAGARIEGPAVAALERCFRETWVEAGGARFEIATPPAVGTSAARLVVHHGLRDARVLEEYLGLIDAATSHLCTVNGFPLILELQRALLRALRRGVRVRMLLGCMAPTHGGQPFAGPWATARTAATELVHSRTDPIVDAGGEIYLFARHDIPGWAPGLGVVHPHVHAKAISVDGRRCAVGSANLDITASYWESELLLVVEDPAVARRFEATIDAMLAGSTRVHRDDPAWQQLAARRAWMRHWPGVLSV